MKQTAHTWIAIRALGLIQKDAKTRKLAKILAPWVKHSYIGCWLPDMPHFKKGHGLIQNHTFKMKPLDNDPSERFILNKPDLLAKLDPNIALHSFISAQCSLSNEWWGKSYKADQPDGRHLPDCMSSIYDTIMDLILLGDAEVDDIVPGNIGFSDYLNSNVTIKKEQISTFFFMMSHYVADSFMPLHCDKRPLAAFTNGKAHKQWEKHWDDLVGDYFKKDRLLNTSDDDQQIIDKSKEIDDDLGLEFNLPITYEDSDDIWRMAIYWCRASFAFSSHIFPEEQFPYDGDETPKYGTYLRYHPDLADWDRIVLQSAVYSVASIWKKIWRKFKD